MTIHFYKAKIKDSPSEEYFSADDTELFKSSPKNVLLNKQSYLRSQDIKRIKEISYEQYINKQLPASQRMEKL